MRDTHPILHLTKHALRFLVVIFGFGLHLFSSFVLYKAFQPFARWYWQAEPFRGVDLLNAATYQAYLARYFAPLPTAWKYLFFNGEPLIIDYPSLHFYFGLPLTAYMTPVRAVQLWMLVATFLFFLFSYLLFARLSKSRSLSAVLSILMMFSVNVYGALIWGGSIPYAGTLFFLPLTLYLLTVYFQSGRKRFFAGAILALGISQYGHAQIALSYGFAFSALSILLSPRMSRAGVGRRFVEVVLFFALVFLIGLPITGSRLVALLRVPANITAGLTGAIPVSYQATPGPQVADEIREFYRTRIYQFYTDTHPWLFILAGIAIIVFLGAYFTRVFFKVMRGKRERTAAVFLLLWITSLLGYTALYLYLYSIGIDLFHGGWFRVFWPVPMLVGMLTAAAVGGVVRFGLSESRKPFLEFVWLLVDAGLLVLVLGIAFVLYTPDFTDTLYLKSVASAGFPGKVIFAKDSMTQQAFSNEAVPEWLPVQNRDYRLYSADQTYNMWFNTFYDMPLARGYIDPTITDAQRWGIFLTDIALDNNVAVEKFDYPPEMAENTARFVLDWNAIRYLAGEGAGPAASNTTLFSSYLTNESFVSRDERVEILGARLDEPGEIPQTIYLPEGKNSVRYLEVNEDLVSPVLSSTNAPAVMFIGDEPLWEVFIRTLAQMGLTSKDLIPVKGPRFIDQLSFEDLSQFDALVLYGYDYRDHGKAWLSVERFVEQGGMLFVDTGAEVKESDSVDLPPPYPTELPAVFPVSSTQRDDLGKEWDVSASEEVSDISFASFAPLRYDGGPWNVSYAGTDAVEDAASVILSIRGKPVVASWTYGSGSVVWSGLNLPAHMEQNRNIEESVFLERLVRMILPEVDAGPASWTAEFLSPQQRSITGRDARGILFKESNFPGWSARLTGGGKTTKLRIFRAGLGYPGVMWVSIPEELRDGPFEVEFVFRGDTVMWVKFLLAAVTALVLFDSFAFNGKLFGAVIGRIWGFVRSRVGRWWEHEEE